MNLNGAKKATLVYLAPELRAKADDLARGERTSLTRFLEWCIQQFLNLDFLSKENRDFVRGLSLSLGSPWTEHSVIECLLTSVRKEIRAERLQPFFYGVGPKPAVLRAGSVSPETCQAPSEKKSTGD